MYFSKCISQNVFLKMYFSECISQNVFLKFDYAHVGILILQILQILQILILILQKKIVGILILDITFDRVLAFDLIESERSPPKFFTAPEKNIASM